MKKFKSLQWCTLNRFIDLETGEVIPEQEAKINYFTVRKLKSTHVNRKTNIGTITITNECRRFKQYALW